MKKLKNRQLALKIKILKRMVRDDRYLEAWKQTERLAARNKRYSFRTWLFCHQVIEKAEELRKKFRGCNCPACTAVRRYF